MPKGGNGGGGKGGGGGGSIVRGSKRDDVLRATEAAEVIDGKGGFDFVTYVYSDVAVRVDLNAESGSGGYAEGDSYVSIEAVVGSIYGDFLAGDENDNTIMGHDGDDVIYGGRGGLDLLIGGDGEDTVNYASHTSGVTVDLSTARGYYGPVEDGVDILDEIENVVGSNFDDEIVSDRYNNTFTGGAGADTFKFVFTNGTEDGDPVLGFHGGDDTITDFDPDFDTVVITANDPNDPMYLLIEQDGDNTIISYADADYASTSLPSSTITLLNVDMADLDLGDYETGNFIVEVDILGLAPTI